MAVWTMLMGLGTSGEYIQVLERPWEEEKKGNRWKKWEILSMQAAIL